MDDEEQIHDQLPLSTGGGEPLTPAPQTDHPRQHSSICIRSTNSAPPRHRLYLSPRRPARCFVSSNIILLIYAQPILPQQWVASENRIIAATSRANRCASMAFATSAIPNRVRHRGGDVGHFSRDWDNFLIC